MRPIILLVIVSFVFLAGCSRKDAGIDETNIYAKFSKSNINAAADADSVAIPIRWSKTKWALSASANGFITGFSRNSGGDETNTATSGIVYVRLKANLSHESRSQDIFIKNISTDEEERMIITQSPLSTSNIIAIDLATRYQKITEFGGMYNPKIWMGQSGLITSDEMTKMFGPNGLGYSILRLMVYPNSEDWQADVAGAKLAQQYGAVIFASPWDCTNALAETIQVDGKSYKHLKKENYRAYADHLVSYINFMKRRGVDLYAISIQNEPDADFTYWYPDEIVDFIKKHGDQVRATGVKLMAPESLGFQPSYTNAILNDAAAFAKTDIVVGHTYQGIANVSSNYVKERNQYVRSVYINKVLLASKAMWMTEKYFDDDENATLEENWKYQLTNFGAELHTCMDVGFDAYIYWYLKRHNGWCGMIGVKGEKNTASVDMDGIAKDGYILSHYAKYATGRTRVGVIQDVNISATDFLTTAYAGSNDITIVLVNKSTVSKIISFVVPSNIRAATAIETTLAENMSVLENSISNDKKSVRIRVLPESIISLKIIL